jgi:hypothetical protein
MPTWGTEMNSTSSASILMNEVALARLEAGLRAQREKLRSAQMQPSPALSPGDNDGTPMGPFSSPPKCSPIDLPDFLKGDGKRAPG